MATDGSARADATPSAAPQRTASLKAAARVRSNMLAAVDVQLRAGHVGTGVGAEEVDRLGDLVRRAEAVEGNLLHDLVRAGREDRGVDFAGRNGVDPHPERPEVPRHFAG